MYVNSTNSNSHEVYIVSLYLKTICWDPSGPSICSCESDFLPDTELFPINDRSSDIYRHRPGDFSYGLILSEELMRVNGGLGLILLPD